MTAVDASQAKVRQLDLSAAGHQDVLGLQVAMDHAVRVQESQAAQELLHQVLTDGERHRHEGVQNQDKLFDHFFFLSSPLLSLQVVQGQVLSPGMFSSPDQRAQRPESPWSPGLSGL